MQGRLPAHLAVPRFAATNTPIKNETGPCPDPVRIGYRSFDRQWIIPDKRLINQPNPTLWGVRSDTQIYLTAPQDTAPVSGPAATLTADIPDAHHYHGRGGRVYPLWLDPAGTVPNVVPGLLVSPAWSRQECWSWPVRGRASVRPSLRRFSGA
jgi:Type ISP C-terminal specificity domain